MSDTPEQSHTPSGQQPSYSGDSVPPNQPIRQARRGLFQNLFADANTSSALPVMSLVTGILSIPLFILILPGAIALFAGLIVLIQGRGNPRRGIAIAGVVLGGLSLLIFTGNVGAALRNTPTISAPPAVIDTAPPTVAPTLTTVPKLTGVTGDVAQEQLLSVGLKITWDAGDEVVITPNEWRVVSQTPTSDTQVNDGAVISAKVVKIKKQQPSVEPTPEATIEEPVTPVEPDPGTDSESGFTLAQENAVLTAQEYLDTAAFSRSGLIDQLKYEGYSKSEASFAVDYISPDWDEQAGLAAQEYLDTMPFSRSDLIDQLKYDGFTTSQAQNGVAAVGY